MDNYILYPTTIKYMLLIIESFCGHSDRKDRIIKYSPRFDRWRQ